MFLLVVGGCGCAPLCNHYAVRGGTVGPSRDLGGRHKKTTLVQIRQNNNNIARTSILPNFFNNQSNNTHVLTFTSFPLYFFFFVFAMDGRIDFDINESLKHYLSDPASIQTPEASSELVDCENDPESLTGALINGELNPVVDAVTENPDAITRNSYFDTLQFLLKCAPIIPNNLQQYISDPDYDLSRLPRTSSQIPLSALSKILDLIVSGLSAQADIAHADLEADEQETIQHHKQLLEVFGFLLQWTVAAVETRAAEKSASAPAVRGRGGKGAKSKAGASKDANWDSSGQLQTALDVMSKVMKLKLAKIFVTTSERDTFISLFTRPVYLILENEARVKNTAIRMHAFKVLCIAVKHHGHAFGEVTGGRSLLLFINAKT